MDRRKILAALMLAVAVVIYLFPPLPASYSALGSFGAPWVQADIDYKKLGIEYVLWAMAVGVLLLWPERTK